MALLEKDKCLEIQMKNDEELHERHYSENYFTSCVKTIFKTVCNLFGSIVIVSYLTSSSFCILREDISRAHLISTLLAGAGLSCLLLGILSSKLSVTGGSRLGYLVCAILFLNQPSQLCPGNADMYAMGADARTGEWQRRFHTVQGGVLLVSAVEILFGIIGTDILVKYIRPVSISPTLILLGTYVMKTYAPTLAEGCWKLFFFSCFLIILIYFISHRISSGYHSNKSGLRRKMFIGLLAVVLVWMMCALFSKFEVIRLRKAARTDIYNGALHIADPFQVPYIFQWGLPRFKLSTFFVMLPAAYISLFEILANYYIEFDRTSQVNNKQNKLIERNTWSLFLMFEGVLSLLIGTMAPGLCVTIDLKSKNQRLPSIITGAIMVTAATSGFFCALMTTIPEPIVSAFIFLIFMSVCIEGLSLLQCVNLNSSRNHYILGISLFLGLVLPKIVGKLFNPELFSNPWICEVFWSIMSTEFLIGGTVAVILDNLADVLLGADTKPRLIKKTDIITDSSVSLTETPQCDRCLSIFV